jgi:hypothetical protein
MNMTQLFYDERDDAAHEQRGSRILYWLDDLGAKPLAEARPVEDGFLFAGARPLNDYRRLVANLPLLRDRPEERAPLLMLDDVLAVLDRAQVSVRTPRTWILPLDAIWPEDLEFPLFVRSAISSFKLGGKISRVVSIKQLQAEAHELRRAFGWDAVILARRWHDLAEAGHSMYGPIPQEVRVWIVDGVPFAWSFHYMHAVESPRGFPLNEQDLQQLAALSRQVGSAFASRCVVADFARETNGSWLFIEAGPGSCAGTAHEGVFKAVAARLRGDELTVPPGDLGGIFV